MLTTFYVRSHFSFSSSRATEDDNVITSVELFPERCPEIVSACVESYCAKCIFSYFIPTDLYITEA